MNHTKTHKLIIVVLLIISIVLATFCFYLYADNNRLNEQKANDNISNWDFMLEMTRKIQFGVKTVDDVAAFSFYQNTVLYMISRSLNPAFNGDDVSFLTIKYDPLMQYLSNKEANKQVPEALLKEGLDLYLQMNSDLNKLCNFVITSSENAKEFKFMLLKDDSKISREVQTKISDFCIKYQPLLDDFTAQISSARK